MNKLTTVPSLALSVILSSSSDPSTLSKALALATGDLGEVGRIRLPVLLAELASSVDFPEKEEVCTLTAKETGIYHTGALISKIW